MVKSRSAILCFLAAASVLLCNISSANAEEKVLLRVHLQPGQKFDQGMSMEAETARTIENQRTDRKINQRIGFHDEVLSVDKDGTVKLKTTFQSLVFNVTTMADGKIQSVSSYDSARHPAVIAPELRIMAAIIGQSAIITISSRGKIVKVEGIDAIAKKAADIKVPEIVRDFTIGALKDFLESTSNQAIGMLVFATPAIRIGDSWTETISQSVFRPTQLNVKYTLISRKDGVAVISVFSAIKTSLTGMLSGMIQVDEKTGLIISSELQEYKGDKPATTTSKNVVHKKSKPAADSSFTINSQATMRRWTVKLP